MKTRTWVIPSFLALLLCSTGCLVQPLSPEEEAALGMETETLDEQVAVDGELLGQGLDGIDPSGSGYVVLDLEGVRVPNERAQDVPKEKPEPTPWAERGADEKPEPTPWVERESDEKPEPTPWWPANGAVRLDPTAWHAPAIQDDDDGTTSASDPDKKPEPTPWRMAR